MIRPANPLPLWRPLQSGLRLCCPRRWTSTEAKAPQSRVARINSRLPRFLRRFTVPLADAPISHITSFLILHELTAVAPLLGFFGAFHYFDYLPPFLTEGAWVKEGIEKFGNYFRRKGWLGDEDSRRDTGWRYGEGATRVLVEVGAAWALTKALLPLRLIVSVWATPWFARWFVLPIAGRFASLFGRRKAAVMSAQGKAAGTGATAAGSVTKNTTT
ncbi:uncharacterized protein PV09_02126 [Verruconis gallopava]|uniref:Uncharacterized protein n=1 Tax=Verruconis gallopava TaxID=253628 RepID=A0A0D1XWT9_9PEZI|nr:uncharacterized protein PV09_02126 [Verruconis gallopava]KIW07271.1 hypothetical protein PV09_02126 [Verruconis gallopava]